MIRLNSEKTYRVVSYLLKNERFTQTEVHEETGVSIGRVNQVVQWLMDRGYVEKRKRYELIAPLAVVKMFPLLRSMEEQKICSLEVEMERERIAKWLSGKKVVYCLTSALQEYDSYFRDPSINFYGDERIARELKELPGGLTRVNVYGADLDLEPDTVGKGGNRITSEARTVIDLFCDNRAYATERLVKKLWGG